MNNNKSIIISGFGVHVTDTGSKYEGQFSKGKQHGYGTMTYENGTRYTGNWFQGKYSGKGKYYGLSNYFYDGEWLFNKMNGFGTLITQKGDKYTGNFVKGLFNGKGNMIYKTGIVYTGDWKDGMPHGFGTQTLLDGSIVHAIFKNGNFDGDVSIVSNGERTTCTFTNNKVSGEVVSYQTTGVIIKRYWENNSMNGKIKVILTDKSEIQGEVDSFNVVNGIKTELNGTKTYVNFSLENDEFNKELHRILDFVK
ncbi:phosphatidylinositol-4-phosphate_5-kinase [Hexamita inflata]|uniref:Phosphatidylinositol-4-phosphate 5-kinase n=1 Tax=Hexamita inflata TaxID=28002 RepID=A0AA86TJC7_9EUKA|nr:phosphatidylinositol-4-phosphate 5-kinase [Hexamita inflata]